VLADDAAVDRYIVDNCRGEGHEMGKREARVEERAGFLPQGAFGEEHALGIGYVTDPFFDCRRFGDAVGLGNLCCYALPLS